MPSPWLCPHCQSVQTDELRCQLCEELRFACRTEQVAEHVSEHVEDGLTEPLDVLKAMHARPCYRVHASRGGFSLAFIAQQVRLVTKDTRAAARRIAQAAAARMTLNVVHNGDTKDHLGMLKGIQVLGEVVEHKGEVQTIVKHVYEQLPPKGDAS